MAPSAHWLFSRYGMRGLQPRGSNEAPRFHQTQLLGSAAAVASAARRARAASRANAAHRCAHEPGRGRSARTGAPRSVRQGLRELGWTDGRNVRIDIRWAAGNADDTRKYAAELVALAPDVILASGGTVVGTLLQTTRTVPIVFTQIADPVGGGLVASLARPGGNATGFTAFEYGMGGKWLELLKEIAPRVTRAAVLRDPAIPQGIGQFGAIQSVAPSLGLEVSPVNVRDAGEIERDVTAFARDPNGGLIVTGSGIGNRSSRTDRHAGGPIQVACGLLFALLRHRRRPDLLWA